MTNMIAVDPSTGLHLRTATTEEASAYVNQPGHPEYDEEPIMTNTSEMPDDKGAPALDPTALQQIPTVADAQLLRGLFDFAAGVRCEVTIHAYREPAALAALRTWAEVNGQEVTEHELVGEVTGAFSTFEVETPCGGRIVVFP